MKASLPLFAAAAVLALGGCNVTRSGPLTARSNPSLSSVHQPVVHQSIDTLDLQSAGGLAAGEAERLALWLHDLAVRPGDRLSIDTADDGARAAVADIADRHGLRVDAAAPAAEPGSVRLTLTRTMASVPGGCPNWDNVDLPGAPIATDPSYGCATNANLAAMIADPSDLIRGRSGGPLVNGEEAAKGVKTHRNRTQTGISGSQTTDNPVLDIPAGGGGEE